MLSAVVCGGNLEVASLNCILNRQSLVVSQLAKIFIHRNTPSIRGPRSAILTPALFSCGGDFLCFGNSS
uniref:Uncharacterized protein n=1 Tax=Physcomitrium patens TaxID=3218 RepID=A0A7I3ZIM6_PHYPA